MQNCETGAAGEGVGASGKMCDSEHHLWLLLISTSFNLKNHQGKWKRHITQTRKAWTRPILHLQAFNDTRDLSDMIRCTDASPWWLKCAIRGRNWCLQMIFHWLPCSSVIGSKNRGSRKGQRIWPLVSLSVHHRKHADRCNKWFNELCNHGSRLVTIWTLVQQM